MPDAVFSFGSTFVIGLLSAVVISRLYGITVVGQFALVVAPYGLLSLLSNFGEQVAFVRALSSEPPGSRRSVSLFLVVLGFSTCLTAVVGAAVAVLSVVLLRGPADQPGLVGPALTMVAVYVVFANVSWNCDTLLVTFRHTRSLALCRLFDGAFLLGLIVVWGLVGDADLDTLVRANVATVVLAVGLRLALARSVLTGRPDREGLRRALDELPDLLRFGARIVPAVMAQAATQQAPVWIVGSLRSVEVLGAFSRANGLASRIIDAGYRVGEVVLPSLSASVAAGRHQEASDRFVRWRLVTALVLLAACLPVAGAGEGLLELFGPGFSQAWLALGLLLFAYGAGVVAGLQGQFLLALGRPGLASRLVLVRAALALSLMGPLVAGYGTTGAAVALAVGHAIELVLAVRATRSELRRSGASVLPTPWLRLAAAGGAGAVVARAVDLALSSFPGAVLSAGCGVLVLVLVVLGSGAVDPAAPRALEPRRHVKRRIVLRDPPQRRSQRRPVR